MTLRALRLTAEAARRLGRARGTGRVHSAFARALNLELDGAGWVSLHGPGPIPSPFGVACDRWVESRALSGRPVRVEVGALGVGDRLLIEVDHAQVSETTLPTSAPIPAVSRCLAAAGGGGAGRAGLLPVTSTFLMGRPLPVDPLSRLAAPALAGLAAATAARDPGACVSAARWLVGLGPGLTPAGDDFLVGWLGGAWTSGRDGVRLVAAVGGGLLAAAGERTGALSRAFLVAALDGQAAEPVCAFACRPDDDARLAGLLALGATSGADLLAGYLVARQALQGAGSGRAARARAGARPEEPAWS